MLALLLASSSSWFGEAADWFFVVIDALQNVQSMIGPHDPILERNLMLAGTMKQANGIAFAFGSPFRALRIGVQSYFAFLLVCIETRASRGFKEPHKGDSSSDLQRLHG